MLGLDELAAAPGAGQAEVEELAAPTPPPGVDLAAADQGAGLLAATGGADCWRGPHAEPFLLGLVELLLLAPAPPPPLPLDPPPEVRVVSELLPQAPRTRVLWFLACWEDLELRERFGQIQS